MLKTRRIPTCAMALMPIAAICLMFGSHARACTVPAGVGLKSMYIPQALDSPAVNAPFATSAMDTRALAADSAATDPSTLIGLWQVTYESAGQVVDMAFEVFHTDGTEMLDDITPPAQGNICLGVWTRSAATTYKLTHPSWTFDANGNLTGTANLLVTIKQTSPNRFTGSYTLSYFDTAGKPGPVYSGTVTANRVTPLD